MSDVKHDYIRSRMTPIAELDADDVDGVFAQLETQARDDLRRDGFAEQRNPHRSRARHALRRTGLRDHAGLHGGRDGGARRSAQKIRRRAQEPIRPHGAGRAGRSRVLSRARHRPRAGRSRCRNSRRREASSRTRCARRGRCASTARPFPARSISAKSSMSA